MSFVAFRLFIRRSSFLCWMTFGLFVFTRLNFSTWLRVWEINFFLLFRFVKKLLTTDIRFLPLFSILKAVRVLFVFLFTIGKLESGVFCSDFIFNFVFFFLTHRHLHTHSRRPSFVCLFPVFSLYLSLSLSFSPFLSLSLPLSLLYHLDCARDFYRRQTTKSSHSLWTHTRTLVIVKV